ncbi:MAG: PEP-utilizing enzyme [Desulfobacterales bacterium]
MPEALPPTAAPPGIPAARRLASLLRLPALLLREPECLPGVCLRRAPSAMAALGARLDRSRRPPAATAAEAFAALAFDLETLARIQENNSWPYFHAATQLALLRELAMRAYGLSGEEVLHLISRGSRNVALAIESACRALTDRIRAQPDLARRFAQAPSPESLQALLSPPLQEELERFLAAWGARSRHRTLPAPRWAEAPAEVLGILQALVRTPPSPGRKAPGDLRARSAPPLLRRLARRVTRFLDLREELRFLLDRALFRIRMDLQALGRDPGLTEEVFDLHFAELEDLVCGRLPRAEALQRAEKRRRRFETPWEPSTYWIEGRPEYALPPERSTLRGIGASPGTATGRAVHVFHPAQAALRRGDILIARHTDPGWTPLLGVVAGVVTEEGGLLNHCAIVAREPGIPAVVGVRGVSRLIPEGSRVTVDGGSGTGVLMPE